MKKLKIILSSFIISLLFSCGSNENEGKIKEESTKNDSSRTLESVKNEPDTVVYGTVRDLFANEVSDVVNTLAAEKFETALKKLDHYGEKVNLNEMQKAYFRYMRIYSTIGLVIDKKKSRKELRELLEQNFHKDIVVSQLEISAGNKMPFNQLQVEQDSVKTLKAVCANNTGTNIFCFVFLHYYGEPIKLSPLVGKHAYLRGQLCSHFISDEDINSWICKLHLCHGNLMILEDQLTGK